MIDAIYASANGSRRGDRLEARAIESMFGDRVPVVATKGYFGEYAAGGAVQLAAAALAIRDQMLHASAGFESADDDVHLHVTRDRRTAAVNHILVNALSAGGGIVSMVLSKEAR